MKNKTKIKIKTLFSKSNRVKVIAVVLCSLILGYVVKIFGQSVSYFETEIITAIISLFGFSLTATVFVYQAIEKKQSEKKDEKVKKVISSLANTLVLTFCLIVLIIILEFICTLNIYKTVNDICEVLKNAVIVYSFFLQADIINCFVVILTNNKSG